MNSKIMKQRNSIFAVLYTLLLVLTIYMMGTLIYNQVESMKYWDFYASFDFEEIVETGENGESKIVYGISTPEQLAGMFAQKVYADDYTSVFEGTKYRLTASIDLSGKSWTAKDLNKNITLDGAGFVIKNLTISSTTSTKIGFVSTNNGTIKNIVFENPQLSLNINSSVTNYIGGVCGENKGTVDNCVMQGGKITELSTSSAIQHLGGIIGTNSGTVTNCTNNTTITQGGLTGGIVGYNNSKGLIEYCYNRGNVSISEKELCSVGGICGFESSSNGTIQYCLNFGTIKGETNDDGVGYVGGICGYSFNVIGCGNLGEISGGTNQLANSMAVGGIAGRSNGNIEGCYNLGSVYANAKKMRDNTLEGSKEVYSKEEFSKKFYSTKHGGYIKFPDLFRYTCSKLLPHTHKKRDSYDFSISYCLDYSNSETVYAHAGGIAGIADNSVSNCYSISSVSGGAIYKEIEYENTAYCSYTSIVDANSDNFYSMFINPQGPSDEILKNQYERSSQYAALGYYQEVYVQPIANLASDGSITNCLYLSSAHVNISSRNITNISVDDANDISVNLKRSTEEKEDSYKKTGTSVNLPFDTVYAKNMSVEGDWGDNNCGGGVFLDKRNSIIEFYYNNNSTKNTITSLLYTDYQKNGWQRMLSVFQSSDILDDLNANGKTYFGYDPSKNNGYPYLLEIYW